MKSVAISQLLENPQDVAILRDALRAVGYSSSAICEALSIPGPPHRLLTSTAECAFVYYDERRAAQSSLAALGMLLTLGGWINREAYERALPPAARSVVERYGIVEDVLGKGPSSGGGYVRATVGVAEYRSRLFFSDRLVERSPDSIRLTQEGSDHVDPPGYPSTTLLENVVGQARATRTGRFLDVGCGTGCLGILAAGQYREVVGIDVNRRALCLAELGAAVNEVEVDLREADCLRFEDDRGFDQIVFNVPSVPHYKAELDKLDTYTSPLGHTLAISFLNARLPSLLAPEGTCNIWSIFALRHGEGSVEELLRRELHEMERYAVEIVTETGSPFGLSRESLRSKRIPRDSYLLASPADAGLLADFLERNGIVCLATALVTLTPRRTSRPRVVTRDVESLVPGYR